MLSLKQMCPAIGNHPMSSYSSGGGDLLFIVKIKCPINSNMQLRNDLSFICSLTQPQDTSANLLKIMPRGMTSQTVLNTLLVFYKPSYKSTAHIHHSVNKTWILISFAYFCFSFSSSSHCSYIFPSKANIFGPSQDRLAQTTSISQRNCEWGNDLFFVHHVCVWKRFLCKTGYTILNVKYIFEQKNQKNMSCYI